MTDSRKSMVDVMGASVWTLLLSILLAPVQSEARPEAFWCSLLIPGWGQYQLDLGNSATRFAAAEVGLWAAYFGLEHVESIRSDTYRTYASSHSGAFTAGKGTRFFDDLGFYDSREQHNRLARIDDGPEAELYPATTGFSWEWDDRSSRERYRELRNSAANAGRQALFVGGLILANHLVSAIHAGRASQRQRADLSSSPALHTDIAVGPIATGGGSLLTTRWR